MKNLKVEIPIILITIIILAMLALSGKQVYQSLSDIVSSMLAETRPDHKLMLAKDISADLNDMENAVKLYSLSENRTYLRTYSDLNASLSTKLIELQNYAVSDSANLQSVDSLVVLANQKMAVWKNILNLYLQKQDEHEAFSQYSEKLDTIMVVQDTVFFPEEEKVGFFKRVFGKKQEPPEPVIVDRTEEKKSMQEEIAKLENEISQRNKEISAREAAYMRKNQEINEDIFQLISKLEQTEQEDLVRKTEEADLLANETFERLAWFALAVILLLIMVLFLFFRDLRKSRKYQKVLRQAKTEAEDLAKAKEVFAATVSHEMRTPVSAIYGLSEQLLQQKHDAKTQRDLDIIHKSTRHLIDLVNDTFDFTRIENKRLELQLSDFRLSDVVEELSIYHRNLAKEKGIAFELSKSFMDDLVIFSDEGRLRQILNNLITNAIKFTDEGAVKLNIHTKSIAENLLLQFEISDTGIGIPDDQKDQVFKDFVQLDSPNNKKAGGTGLGLFIVKKLVDLLQGDIKLESKLGIGTTFFVTIPTKPGNPSKLQTSFQSFEAPEVLKGKRILIVDDEEFNLHLLRNILTKWKIKFDQAENGRLALDLAEKTTYPLILMDIRMPVMNGIEATKKLRETGTESKIIALSANTNQKEVNVYLESGFDNFLLKPFNEASLYNVIKQTLKGEEIRQEEIVGESGESMDADLSDLIKMANGDPAFVREMIEIFEKSSEKSLQSIEENIRNKNWQAVADLAHKLAAPAKHLNAHGVYSKLKQLQNHAESEVDAALLEKQFKQVKNEILKLIKRLRQLLKANL